MTKLSFSIPGEPKGKGRARAHPRIVWEGDEPRAVVSLHTPADTAAAEKAIADLFRAKFPGHRPWTGAVLIRFTAVFETPVSFNKALQAAARSGRLHCVKKPDKDNIEKLIVDALNKIAWHDDAQVMGGGVKRYGSPARIDVTIETLETPDLPATPGQKRLEQRVAAGTPGTTEKRLRANPSKSGKGGPRYPAHVQARIDQALERDRIAKAKQPTLFGGEKA